MCGAPSSPPVPLSLRERGDDMPCEWGSGLFGTGARRRRPNSCSSASGVARSRASATWRAGRRPGRRRATMVEVAGRVVARQRPETAKGFIFVLLEEEAGMVNVIVRPDVYERYRRAIGGEPLLWVRGKLAKDDGTVNVIAEEAAGLKCGAWNAEGRVEDPPVDSAHPTPHSAFAFLQSLRGVPPR